MAKIKTTNGPSMVKVWIAAGVAFALVAAVLIAYQLGRSDSDPEAAPDPTTPTGSASTDPDEQQPLLEVANYQDWEVQPDRIAALPEATGEVAGLPTDFPQTELGAVAYVIAVFESTSTTDEKKLEDAVAAYYSDEERLGQTQAQSVEDLRLHWATAIDSTDLPQDAEIRSTTYGFAVTSANDAVFVSRAYTVQLAAGDEVVEENLAETVGVVWKSGRWEIALQSEADLAWVPNAPSLAAPGTTAFNAEGWTAIERGER